MITRKVLPREELFRIVRTPDEQIVLDEDGETLGRGMHVSKDPRAVEALFSPKKKGLWRHALKMDISAEAQNLIRQKIEQQLHRDNA